MSKTTTLKIEKGVPLPNCGPGRIYPFPDMQVGDSFYTPNKASRGGIYIIAKRQGLKITVRNEGEGIRVWRIA